MRRKERISDSFDVADIEQSTPLECPAVTMEQGASRCKLDGNLARRELIFDGVIWDERLTGFGLRVRPSGYKAWIVKLAERGRPRMVTLGPVEQVTARAARARARELIERALLDGLPVKRGPGPGRAAPLFREFAPEFWGDYAHHWKPSTQRSNRGYLRREILPAFGDMALDAITRADVLRWRDDLAARSGVFNRALPVLAVMFAYAEQLGYRPKGSNPTSRVPRYKRQLPERYLSDAEYRRLGRALQAAADETLLEVAVIRLLLLTGARLGEITTLRWEWVQPPRLVLPDSKTGPKTIWLNGPALAVLDGLPGPKASGPVFPGKSPGAPISLHNHWHRLRRRAALPDVRLHDLRHSFASVAIADGMHLSVIGKLLGHALAETTARYAHLADEQVADAADRVCNGIATALGAGA